MRMFKPILAGLLLLVKPAVIEVMLRRDGDHTLRDDELCNGKEDS